MKPLPLCLLGLLAALFTTIAPVSQAANASEETILKLEQHWQDALTRSDTNTLDKLYAETLVYTHSNGKVDTKSSYIKTIQSGATQYKSMKRDDIKVSVYGQAAVVTCHWDVHILSQGKPVDMNARYLHVYVQQPGGWKLVAHESTRVAP